MKPPDYSLLDKLDVHQSIFFPRQDWTPPPQGATDHFVPVAEGISISCRFYPTDRNAPTILYFHGNGEVVCDHDWIAPLYHKIGVNLFVADYRGYGKSDGQPTFTDTIADAQAVFNYFRSLTEVSEYSGEIFVMGRSLGSLSAIELAATHAEALKGMILESGAGNLIGLFRRIDMIPAVPEIDDLEEACWALVETVTIPSLIIHGEQDVVIPYDDGVLTYAYIGAEDKRLLGIPNAGHNDILLVGMEDYFEAIRHFVFRQDT